LPKNSEITPGEAALEKIAVARCSSAARRSSTMSRTAASGSVTVIAPVQAGADRFRRPGFSATISALRG